MKKKKVILPLWFLRIMGTLSEKTARGDSVKARKTLYKFADEAYRLSYSPSGMIGQNPFTPSLHRKLFSEFKIETGRGQVTLPGLISDLGSRFPKSEVDSYIRRIHVAVSSLAQIYCDLVLGHEKDVSYSISKNLSDDQIRDRYLNILSRVVVQKKVMSMVADLLVTPQDEVSRRVQKVNEGIPEISTLRSIQTKLIV